MNYNPEKMGKGIRFERLRRITGYIVGTMDKWNNAKKAEERDRVKHGVGERSEHVSEKHGVGGERSEHVSEANK